VATTIELYCSQFARYFRSWAFADSLGAMAVPATALAAASICDIADLQRESLSFYHTLRRCQDTYLAQHINTALDVLTDACRLYGMDNLLSSYNGGKDADVIMHLLRAVAAKLESDSGRPHTPKLVHFVIEDEFPEVIDHITLTEKRYKLDIKRYDCGIMQVSGVCYCPDVSYGD
jgi:hypothetical protein